jgi:hypothetical protein
MNDKYSLKIIQSGKTQQVKILREGAGISGQAFVLKVVDGVRLQLVNTVTLVSPDKIELKRVGRDLHLALPSGDLSAPDLIVEDYFAVSGASLQGRTIDGEWMTYDAASLLQSQPLSTSATPDAAVLSDAPVVQREVIAALDGGGPLWKSPWAWVGGLAVAAGGGSGSGSGSGSGTTPSTDTKPQTIITNYSSGGVTTAPTIKNYTDLGVTLPAISGVTSAAMLDAMNAVVASKAAVDVNGATALNTLALSLQTAYAKILVEANDGATADATPGVNPTVADYASVGVVLSSKSRTLDLLNNALGELVTTDVDTVAELKVLAITAGDVMLLAAGDAATQTDTQLVNGLNALLKTTYVSMQNIGAIKATITAKADDGSAVDTVTELKTIAATQILKDYASVTNGVGVTIVPTLATYKDAGIDAPTNLTATTRIAVDDPSLLTCLGTGNATAVTSAVWLSALNAALDKQDGTTLDKAKVQAMVDSYYRILAEADGVVNTTTNTQVSAINNDPTATDYDSIGGTVGNAKSVDLLNDFVGLSADAAVDTVDEINATAKAAYNVMLLAGAAGANNSTGAAASTTPAVTGKSVPTVYVTDAEWVAGLTALGVSGVTTSNIGEVKKALEDSAGDGSGVDTVAEVQSLVSLVRMQAFTDDPGLFSGTPAKSAAAPNLADWSAVGVKALAFLTVTEATQTLSSSNLNLSALNSALDRWAKTDVSQTNLQSLANAYARIFGEADGDRTVDVDVNADSAVTNVANDPTKTDYDNVLGGTGKFDALMNTLGTSTQTTEVLALLNDIIGGLSITAVDTATEVEDLIKVSANVMKQAMTTPGTNAWSYSTDSEWITALSTLGISGLTGMSVTNLAKVKDGITAITAATDIDTWAELQGIVSLVRINDNAANSANSLPNFPDFQAFFTYGVADKTDIANTSVYLNAFRDAVQYKLSNAFSAAEVGSMINGYAAILAEANGITSDQQIYDPQAFDYLAVGMGWGASFDTVIRNMLGDSNGNGVLDGSETTSQFANLLTDVVSTKNQTDVDTVIELNDFAKTVVKIYELEKALDTAAGFTSTYTSITNGALMVSELNALGLNTSVLTDNGIYSFGKTTRMNGFYDAIIKAAGPSSVDSLAELQTMINNTSVL